MSQHIENIDEVVNHHNNDKIDHPDHIDRENREDDDLESYEYENIFQDHMVDKVRDELNQRITSFDEDLKRLEFVLAMIKERRKKYKDVIFSKNDEELVKNCCDETRNKLQSAKKRLADFDALMETKVKALEFAINQRWMDLQYIEKSTDGLFDRVPKLKNHFYDTQEEMEREADGVISALEKYIEHLTISDEKSPTPNNVSRSTSPKKLSKPPKLSHKRFSPARMNTLLEDMIQSGNK
jgi:hypothetical protein